MIKDWLPACFHPSTVVMVDDNAKYLHAQSIALDNDIACYKTFDIPMRAVSYLSEEYRFDPFTNRCLRHPEEEELEHRVIDIDIRKIHQEIYNPNRFSQISVLIVDYAMPGMNGLEVCKVIKNAGPIRKILLTGEADEKLAINAFNQRIIDKFIRKDERDFQNVVNGAIHELQVAYFRDISKVVINSLTDDFTRSPSCLNDGSFMRYFTELCKEQKIEEYYLMDSTGSFLLLDINNKPSWLAVKNEEEVHDLYKFAASEGAPQEVLELLNARLKIPYFHTEEELQTPPSEWGKYLHSARLVHGKDLYYCAFISAADSYDIDLDRVKSFHEYRRQF